MRSKLERIDTCFGSFLTYLQERGLYDNSIIILASDHGESLGTDGYWGHQFFLFPEDVRIPLIVRLPPAMRERFTTDLARVTLLRDVAPTLLAVLGQPVRDLEPPFGAALFVPPRPRAEATAPRVVSPHVELRPDLRAPCAGTANSSTSRTW